jgi:hypothetical protein
LSLLSIQPIGEGAGSGQYLFACSLHQGFPAMQMNFDFTIEFATSSFCKRHFCLVTFAWII